MPERIPVSRLNSTLAILWDITYRCNLSCKHCFVTAARKAGQHSTLSEHETGVLLASLCSGREIVREFNIQGGEPLCAPNLCFAIRWLGKNGIPWSINTNGVLWGQEHFKTVLNYPPVGITISLDGHTQDSHDWLRGSGAFRALMRTVKALRSLKPAKKPIQIDAISVLHKRNVDSVKNILDHAADIGIREIVLNNLSICGSAERNRSSLELEPEKLFPVLDFVCRNRGKYRGMSVYIPWATPRMIAYYNSKYRIRIPILNAGCQAIRSEVTVSPQGHLRPCPNALDRLHVAFGGDVFPDDGTDTKLGERILAEVRSSAMFARVYECLHGELRRPRLARCRRCKFIDRCGTCPSQRFTHEYPTEKLCFSFQDIIEKSERSGPNKRLKMDRQIRFASLPTT